MGVQNILTGMERIICKTYKTLNVHLVFDPRFRNLPLSYTFSNMETHMQGMLHSSVICNCNMLDRNDLHAHITGTNYGTSTT